MGFGHPRRPVPSDASSSGVAARSAEASTPTANLCTMRPESTSKKPPMTTLTLYDTAYSLNCYKVRLLLSLLGVQYERVPVDLLKGEHKTPEFLSINPFGQVPMLEADGCLVRDSQAILVWLSRKYDDGRWLPRDPDDEAEVNAWLAAAAFELRLGPYDARLAKLYPILCVNEQLASSRAAHALELYNRRLTNRNWLALERPTLADVAAFPAISQSGDGDIGLDPYPAVVAWLERVRSLPGFTGLLD